METLLQSAVPSRTGVQAVAFDDGTRLHVLPGGGRVLGLCPGDDEDNFFWANPAPDSAGGTWPNPGGDRTWLAPEIELFIGDLARPAETYAVPPKLDPGHWILAAASSTEINLTITARLRLHRQKRSITARIDKRIEPASNPLAGSGLRYAGYRQNTTLDLTPMDGAALQVGIWNLLQLPSPGTMLISTRTPARPGLVFGTLAAGELSIEPYSVRWTMGGSGVDTKIALKAPTLTGRAGYVRETARPGIWDLVVREFTVAPAGNYVDALWQPPHESGWAFQACCARSFPSPFNELEYHAPAVSTVAGANRGQDESCVWAFRGAADAIADAAQQLLNGRKEAL